MQKGKSIFFYFLLNYFFSRYKSWFSKWLYKKIPPGHLILSYFKNFETKRNVLIKKKFDLYNETNKLRNFVYFCTASFNGLQEIDSKNLMACRKLVSRFLMVYRKQKPTTKRNNSTYHWKCWQRRGAKLTISVVKQKNLFKSRR